jgi:benzoyl-CoA 2,3-dioxygenase component A
VVDAGKCDWCNACISPCPTGSIDNYRSMPRGRVYSLEEQFGWESLPAEWPRDQLLAEAGAEHAAEAVEAQPLAAELAANAATVNSAAFGSTLPPWSAAHA